MSKKKVTLSIDSRIYDSYRDFCEENGLLLSKKIDIFMKKEVVENKVRVFRTSNKLEVEEGAGKKRN